jgi:hypothetical protein
MQMSMDLLIAERQEVTYMTRETGGDMTVDIRTSDIWEKWC